MRKFLYRFMLLIAFSVSIYSTTLWLDDTNAILVGIILAIWFVYHCTESIIEEIEKLKK